VKRAIDIALDMTKQLITLSTGVITVFAAVIGLLKSVAQVAVWYLALALFLEIVSVIFGLLVQGAMVSHLTSTSNEDVYEGTVTHLAKLQWLFFVLGLVMLPVSLWV